MKKGRAPRPHAPSGLLTRGEQKKLLLLAVSALVVAIALVTAILQKDKYEDAELGELPEPEPQSVQRVVVPEIDGERLNDLVADADEAQRVLLESAGLDALLEDARALTPAHYEALGVRELDAEVAAELLADPAAHRAEPLRLRGWVRAHRPRTRDGVVEHRLTLTLEDDTTAHAVVLELPSKGVVLDETFVRIDGLFLKAFTDEVGAEWLTGPLVVGRSAVPSYPELPRLDDLDWGLLAQVEDFSLERGATGLPFEPYWSTMAHARDLAGGRGEVDWEAAPELDAKRFGELLENGAAHRGEAYRLPISKLMGITVKPAGENPARVEEVTEGWIGNTTWPHLVHFRAPFPVREYTYGVLVSARGFFFKNFAYDSKSADVQVAPVFVLTGIERFVPAEDDSMPQLFLGVAVLTVLTIVLLSYLITRDQRRSKELQEKLVSRRRARRRGAEA